MVRLTVLLLAMEGVALACQSRTIPDLVDIPLPPGTRSHLGTPINTITCHVSMAKPLAAAFQCIALHDSNLIRTVNGCYCYRNIRDTDRLSDHAHGTAIDINAHGNGYGEQPTQNPIITWCMKQAGFLWGGDWSTPDGMHYYLRRDK